MSLRALPTYSTRGYPIDLELRRAHRAERGPRTFPRLGKVAAWVRAVAAHSFRS